MIAVAPALLVPIFVALIAAVPSLLSVWLTYKVKTHLKTGNGLTAGQVLYKLMDHMDVPCDLAHPKVPVLDERGTGE